MEYIAYALLILGAAFILLAGLGIGRMPTLFMRMQATSKASTLGVILMTTGLSLHLGSLEAALKGALICVFLLLTTPVAAHAIALAAKQHGRDV